MRALPDGFEHVGDIMVGSFYDAQACTSWGAEPVPAGTR